MAGIAVTILGVLAAGVLGYRVIVTPPTGKAYDNLAENDGFRSIYLDRGTSAYQIRFDLMLSRKHLAPTSRG